VIASPAYVFHHSNKTEPDCEAVRLLLYSSERELRLFSPFEKTLFHDNKVLIHGDTKSDSRSAS